MMCPKEHKHGSVSTCYIQHKCRCSGCRMAAKERSRRRSKLKAYGRFDTGLVDAAPVREHVKMLQASGMGWKRIAEVSGVGKTAVSQLIYGRKGSNKDPRKGEVLKQFGRDKAERLFRVQPDIHNLRAGALVDGCGFRRRVEALMCQGWSMSKQADALGIERGNFGLMLHRPKVTVKHHLAMVELFDAWWNKQPRHVDHRELIAFNRTRNLAKQRGYVPPLGWDDIDNDAQPVIAVNDDRGYLASEVEWLLNAGFSPDSVAEQLCTNTVALERRMARYGRHDLARSLHPKAVA